MEEVFAVQDEIAGSIADRLKRTLKGDQQSLVEAVTDNLETSTWIGSTRSPGAGWPMREEPRRIRRLSY